MLDKQIRIGMPVKTASQGNGAVIEIYPEEDRVEVALDNPEGPHALSSFKIDQLKARRGERLSYAPLLVAERVIDAGFLLLIIALAIHHLAGRTFGYWLCGIAVGAGQYFHVVHVRKWWHEQHPRFVRPAVLLQEEQQ